MTQTMIHLAIALSGGVVTYVVLRGISSIQARKNEKTLS
jgi:hypothetical protein